MKTFPYRGWIVLTFLICGITPAFSQTQLEKAFTKYQEEFQLLATFYPAEEVASLIKESNPDYVFIFESYHLETQQYSYSIRAYNEEDRKIYTSPYGEVDTVHSPHTVITDQEIWAYGIYKVVEFNEQISYFDHGTEYGQLYELLELFAQNKSLLPIQPHIEVNLGYDDTEKEREAFRQKPLYLKIPVIQTETLIDVRAQTSQQIHRVPIKTRAVINSISGERDVCR